MNKYEKIKQEIFLHYKAKKTLETDLEEKNIYTQLNKKKYKLINKQSEKNIGKRKLFKKQKSKKVFRVRTLKNIKCIDADTNKYTDFKIPKNHKKRKFKIVRNAYKIIELADEKKAIDESDNGSLMVHNTKKTYFRFKMIGKVSNKIIFRKKSYKSPKTKQVKEKIKVDSKIEQNTFKINRQVDTSKFNRELLEKQKVKKRQIENYKPTKFKKPLNNNSKNIRNLDINGDILKRIKLEDNKKDNDNNGTFMIDRGRKTYYETKTLAKTTYKTADATYKTSVFIGNQLKNLIVNISKVLIGKVGILVSTILMIIILVSSILGFQASILPVHYVLCTDEFREKFIQEVSRIENNANSDLQYRISSSSYDQVILKPQTINISVDYRYILCIFAVTNNQKYKDEDLQDIENLYNKFYDITETTEDYTETHTRTSIDENGVLTKTEETVNKTRLIITFTEKSVLEVVNELGFTENEIDWLNALLSSEFDGDVTGGLKTTTLTSEELEEVYNLINNISDSKRKMLLDSALTLWGNTGYKWGGKSKDGGGIPIGLDCSGFTDWVYKTALGYRGLSGGGTAYQFSAGQTISSSNLKPGDLGFWKLPNQVSGTQNDANHVGIYIGTLSNGKKVYIHCQGGTGVTINSFNFQYFKTITGANLY